MRFTDLIGLAWDNLWRNRTRSALTLVGVMIGVAALLTLLAYGSGLQDNVRGEFEALELYNTLRVTSSPDPIGEFGDLSFQMQEEDEEPEETVPLTDELIQDIEAIDGVRAAYPEIGFPAEVLANERSAVANVEAIPMEFREISSYQPANGRFFDSPTESGVLIGPSMAERLGYDAPEDAVGDSLSLQVASLDMDVLQDPGALLAQGPGVLPMDETEYKMAIVGLLPDDQQPFSGFTRVLVPLERAEDMEAVTFFSTLDLLMRSSDSEGHAALRVQLEDTDALRSTMESIEELGVYATSFRDQFAELDRLFLIMDLALGVIGFIALIIATIGIANTVMMNVRERYSEIGIMKAVGGDERDLQRLFVAESTMLGVIGGVAGLIFGFGIVFGLDALVGVYLSQQGFPPLSVFSVNALMALGIWGVAVLISLLAGVFPARRAARVEPVEALRSV